MVRNLFLLGLLVSLLAGCATTESDIRNLRNRQDVEGLVSILNEGHDKEARLAAIDALGVIRDPRAVAALTNMLQSESWVEREAAVKSLGNLRDYLVIDPIVTALGDESRFVSQTAAKSLIKVAKSLGKQKDPRVIRHLLNAMSRVDSSVRDSTVEAFQAAIAALSRVQEPTFIDALIDAIGHDNAYVRQQVALALGQFDDPRVIKPLTMALKDSSLEVVEAATQALRRIQNPKSADPLFVALRDKDEKIRDEAAYVLGQYKDPQVIEKIIIALGDRNQLLRAGAAKAMGHILHPRAMMPLVQMLEDEDSRVRQAASETLEKYHWRPHDETEAARYCVAMQHWNECQAYGKHAVEPLVAALNGDDPEIRRQASLLLSKLNWQPKDDKAKGSFCVAKQDWDECRSLGNAAVPALVQELRSEQWQQRASAADTLAKIGNPDAIQPLIKALQDDNADVRVAIVEALATYKDKTVVKPLIDSLDDHNRSVRNTAARVLEQSMADYRALNTHSDISQYFLTALKDNNRGVRAVAAKLLGDLKDPATAEALIDALNDEETDVRIAAQQSLHKIKDNRAIASLVEGLKAENPRVRSQVIGALSEFQDHRAIEPLLNSVNDPDAKVRIDTINALSKIDDPRAIGPLTAALKDYQPSVRKAAATALINVNDSRVIPPLKDSLDDLDVQVREAARGTLLAKNWTPDTKNKKEQANYCIAKRDWVQCEALGKAAIEPLLLELSQDDSPYQVEAARVLGEIKDPTSIKPLINAISNTQWLDDEAKRRELLQTATRALKKFGIQAVPALKPTLTQWYTAQHTAEVMGAIGWRPRTEEDEIHYLVARRANNDLQALWSDAKRILLKDIESKDADRISNALYAFIGIGKEEVISDLLKLLDNRGTVQIAEAYLNSGNDKLVNGAESWTQERGLVVQKYADGNSPVQWGRL